jgi:UDP-N-acetylglucosamine--dolichyl-phosphate N-acetylglucosaminephosphotransferase
MPRRKSRSPSPASSAPLVPAVPPPSSAPSPWIGLAATAVFTAAAHSWCNTHSPTCGLDGALHPLPAAVCLAGLGMVATLRLIPAMEEVFIKARLFGIDLNKPTTKRDASGALVRPVEGIKVPEPMGLVCGTVYLLMIFLFIPVVFEAHLQRKGEPEGDNRVALEKLTEFITAELTITCMLFLGFADDVLDLRWRDRIVIPPIAALPMLLVYSSLNGVTNVTVPTFVQPLVGEDTLELGILYCE